VAERITADDIAAANDEWLDKAGRLARALTTVLLVVAALGVLSWLWIQFRIQTELDTRGITYSTGEPSEAVHRLDALTGNLGVLLQSSLAGAVAAALRLWTSKLLADRGHSLHGARIGDLAPDPDD
jgi:hypothetical protein